MISCALYPTGGSRPPSPPSDEGWKRLAADLERLPAPKPPTPLAAAKQRLFSRIDGEPARVETDAKGAITSINPAFTTMCGFSFPETLGRKPGSFLQGPLTDQAIVRELRRAIAEGRACEVEVVNYHKDGSAYSVRIDLTPVRDEDGTLTGFRAVETKVSDL